jgi:hypothetical protein
MNLVYNWIIWSLQAPVGKVAAGSFKPQLAANVSCSIDLSSPLTVIAITAVGFTSATGLGLTYANLGWLFLDWASSASCF